MDQPEHKKIPQGVYCAALTPLYPDLSCNCEELASHCFDMLERGCQGIVLFGTSGEGPSFSLKERKEVLEELISKGLNPEKIILANGCSGVQDTVELARAALRHNCAALLICPPSFYKNVSEEGIIAYYREIIEKVGNPNLRVILYHIPQFSGVAITSRVIEDLCHEFPETVIGIKESEGNLAFAKEILKRFPGFQVFVANEMQIIEAVQHGAAGSICGIANLYPELICDLYGRGLLGNQSNPSEIKGFFEALKGYSFIPAAKAVMAKRKSPRWQLVCPPLVSLTVDQTDAFLSSLKAAGLEKSDFASHLK